jgi:hypothetical protein
MIDSETATMLPSSGALLVQVDASNQPASTLVEFTLFPKLPMELRLKIWRWSFPRGRVVNLARQPQFLHPKDELRNQNAMSQYPLPVSLHVNCESRTVTLEHYYVLFAEDMEPLNDGDQIRPPLCFNPNLDEGFISLYAAKHDKSADWFTRWIDYLEIAAPALLCSVQNLQLLGTIFDESTFAWIYLRYILIFGSPNRDEAAAAVPISEFEFILAFHSLKRLRFVVSQYCRSSERPRVPVVEKDLKRMEEVWNALLGCYKSYFGGDPPLVEVVNCIKGPLE